ncbi:MAG: HAMP domain-containing sensor histidine kinase [Actinomycetota bacterium]|nr:HAMP domain-containing sensor histidine kinase [Actinomycetota bacterium]
MTLRIRIMASMASMALLLVVIFGVGFHIYVGSATVATLQRILNARAYRAQQLLEGNKFVLATSGSQVKPEEDQSIVQIINRSGELQYTTAAAGGLPLISRMTVKDISHPTFQEVSIRNGRSKLLLLVEPASSASNEVVLVGTSMDQTQDSVSLVDQLLWLFGGLAILLTVVGAGITATFVLRPVARMQREAVRLSECGLDIRLPDPCTRDELADLAVTLNSFLDKLSTSQEIRERFVASASHELRTPLAGMRAELETRDVATSSSDEALLQRLERRVGYLGAIVDGLLLIAEGQAGSLPLQSVEVDLEAVVSNALSTIAPLAAMSDVLLVLDAQIVARVFVDPVRIEQVVENLLSNAVRYSPPGSAVTVSLLPAKAGVIMSVRDHGVGLPAGLERTVFEPFVRVQNGEHSLSRGSGLGLSIVEFIVGAHGGTVKLENHPDGGALATVWLPIGSSFSGDIDNRSWFSANSSTADETVPVSSELIGSKRNGARETNVIGGKLGKI